MSTPDRYENAIDFSKRSGLSESTLGDQDLNQNSDNEISRLKQLLAEKDEIINSLNVAYTLISEVNKSLTDENEQLIQIIGSYRKKVDIYTKHLADANEEKTTLEKKLNFYKNAKDEIQRDMTLLMQTNQANTPLMMKDISRSIDLDSVLNDTHYQKVDASKYRNRETSISSFSNLVISSLPEPHSAGDFSNSSSQAHSRILSTPPSVTISSTPPFGHSKNTNSIKSAASRLLLMSIDDCSSPVSRAMRGIVSPHIPNVTLDRLALLNTPSKIEPVPSPVQDEVVLATNLLKEFLKSELGELYQIDKLFANLNLFQLRHGRHRKEINNSLRVLKEKDKQVELLNRKLTEVEIQNDILYKNYEFVKNSSEKTIYSLQNELSILKKSISIPNLDDQLTVNKI